GGGQCPDVRHLSYLLSRLRVLAAGLRRVAGTSTAAIAADAAPATAPTVNAWVKSWPARCAATRPAPAALDRTATPAAPPSSWKVLTSADRRPASADSAPVSEAVKAVTNVAPIPSAAMASPVTVAAGWVQWAAMAYPAAARARPVTATIRALTRASTWLPACAPAMVAR